MAGLDWVIIGLYFALLLGVAWWVAKRNRDTADDYFLAGRNLGWFLVGATIFASNIGSEHVVGLAGAGDRKSTRLNSSHGYISYAVFCLKKKKKKYRYMVVLRRLIVARQQNVA